MSNINIEIKNTLEILLNSGQTLEEINNNLDELVLSFHHKNEEIHRSAIYGYRSIKDILTELNLFNSNPIVCVENIKKYLDIDDGFFINELHNLMIGWIKFFATVGSNEVLTLSLVKTYESLKIFLEELKIIDKKESELQLVN